MADKRRSARVLAEKKRSIYFEPDSDDGLEAVENSESEPDFPTTAPLAPLPQRSRKKRKLDRRAKPQTRAQEKRRERFKGRAGGRPKKYGINFIPGTPSHKKEEVQKGFAGPSDGRIPDWAALPAEVWREVFVFASQPMHEQTPTALANVTWLMRTARTCRAFAVPALEAYYTSPSILPHTSPHSLLALLRRSDENVYMNYRYRVKCLQIDVRRMTQGARGGHPFHLEDLLQQLPRLQDLQIVRLTHSPPYRSFTKAIWQYPEALFASLPPEVRLKTFRWSSDMVPAHTRAHIFAYMASVHTSTAFSHLERLILCDYEYFRPPDAVTAESEPPLDPAKPSDLAAAVSLLPNLKDLTFISSDIVAEDFLTHLPSNLRRLELSNCLEVTSDLLSTYLSLSGAHLTELVLNHNAALTLSFLTDLRTSCPQLQTLKVDLTYYSERLNFNDAAALYDHVLLPSQTPTWPATLQHLEIKNLQKIEAAAAENLFRSLVDSAAGLLALRFLSLQAHIDIPWRDRAGFRDRWIERFRKVFSRRDEPPRRELGSLKAFRLWKDGREEEKSVRRLSHVRITPQKAGNDVQIYGEAEPTPTKRRSIRVAESSREVSVPTSPALSSYPSDVEEDENDDDDEVFVQGLCSVVDIRIDNQRPRENQYTEANFLDSEPSGDEDWREDGAGSEDDGGGYAW